MSNLTRLQAVSSSLDTAINKAESLPEAGSGGSVSVSQGTITVTDNGMYEPGINEYIFTLSGLDISSCHMVALYTVNRAYCFGTIFRLGLDDDFEFVEGYSAPSGGVFTLDISFYANGALLGGVIGENQIKFYGNIGSDRIIENLTFIAV